jgi:SAM-dependent methyltransferase
MDGYFLAYDELSIHRIMVGDRRRTDAFAEAIREVVKPGDVVADVGTGTGVLALLAAQAGAKTVYAVDQALIAETAAHLVKVNGFEKTVQIFCGPASDIRMEQAPDLIISEWLGNFAFAEGMLDAVLSVRDRFLKPSGQMLPSHVQVMLVPMDDPVLFFQEGPGFWRNPVHGLDFSMVEHIEMKQGRAHRTRIPPCALLSVPQPLVSLDLKTAKPNDPWQSGELSFVASRDGVLNGFAGWFVARLSPNVVLDTAPHFPDTHWQQTYLPFPPNLVKKGEHIHVSYQMDRDPYGPRRVELKLQSGQTSQCYTIE